MRATRRKRIWLTVLAAMLLALGVGWGVGCRTPVDVNMSNLRDGSYDGTSFKCPGPMTVGVKVEAGKLAAIDLKSQIGAQRFRDALTPLMRTMIDRQSVVVDDVTGATVSSRALKRAVADALSKAADNRN